ncbi:MAG: hypothetical protein EP330_28450 [Deltaproteobacteria bacterium]|nr:MAG: hypothetical protein EP330_28450 [Deltaproteobacteria bacterium]
MNRNFIERYGAAVVVLPVALYALYAVMTGDPSEMARRSLSEEAKVGLAFWAAILALGWQVFAWAGPMGKQARLALLGLLTVWASGNYARWNPETLGERVDAYDLAHYYLNARYFDELGYEDLYPAMILADHANGGPTYNEGNIYLAQDERGHFKAPIAHAVARGEVVRETKFTPERWKAFERDSLYISRELPGWSDKLWRQMIQDHGFNGTPVWVALAEPLATAVPVTSLKWLGMIDVVLLAIALGFVVWAYGGTSAVWIWLWLMVSYSLRWPTVSWVFLRYDWIAGLLIAMSLLKKGHYFWAGLPAAWAATLRLFPAMWMWGPFARGVEGLTRKQVDKKLLTFAGAFLLGVAVLQGFAVARVGTEPVEVHFNNMMDHNSAEQLSSRRIGLALALPFRGETVPKFIEPERKAAVEQQKNMRYGIALVLMVLMGWGMRRVRDDEAFGFGFVPFFLLTTASYYYYAARITMSLVHAGDLEKWRNRVGLALLFMLESFTNWAETAMPGHRVFLIGMLAWGLAAYTLLMAGWLMWESRELEASDAS